MYAVRGVKTMTRTIRKASQRIKLRVETILLPKDLPIATLLLPQKRKYVQGRSMIFKDPREGNRDFRSPRLDLSPPLFLLDTTCLIPYKLIGR
jgi:hypothetical protein